MNEELGFNSDMSLNMGGQENADLAHLQDMGGQDDAGPAHLQEGGNDGAELAQPQDIRNVGEMSDDDFSKYILDVSNGVKQETPKPAGETEKIVADEPKGDEKPFRIFATQEEYQKDLDERFNKRFRGRKEQEEAMEQLMRVGREVYGENVSYEEIISKFKDDMLLSGASRRNMEPKAFQEEITLKSKARAFDEYQNQQNRQKAVLEKWQSESDELKAKVPDFDLERAMKNPDFYKSIVTGKSVAQSYLDAFANKKPAQRAISQNAAKGTQMGATTKKDPSQMSDAEFKAYIERIKDK